MTTGKSIQKKAKRKKTKGHSMKSNAKEQVDFDVTRGSIFLFKTEKIWVVANIFYVWIVYNFLLYNIKQTTMKPPWEIVQKNCFHRIVIKFNFIYSIKTTEPRTWNDFWLLSNLQITIKRWIILYFPHAVLSLNSK